MGTDLARLQVNRAIHLRSQDWLQVTLLHVGNQMVLVHSTIDSATRWWILAKKTQDLGFESWKHMEFMGICEHVHKKHWDLYNRHTWIYVCQSPVNSPTMDHLSGILNACLVMEKGDRQNQRISDSSWVKTERIQSAPCKRSPTWALQMWEQSALRGPKETKNILTI